MSWVDDAVGQFGRGMGIDGLSLDDGPVSLAFETSGRLFLERAEGALLVYLARGVPAHRDDLCERALRLCHYENAGAFAPSAALRGDDQLIFLIRLPDADVAPPVLERALETLIDLHDKVVER